MLNYSSLGLAPAMIRWLAGAFVADDRQQPQRIYVNGQFTAAVGVLLGAVVLLIYAGLFTHIHLVSAGMRITAPAAAVLIGCGLLLRLFSDIPGSWLQSTGRLALDNAMLLGGDLCWIVFVWLLIPHAASPLIGAAAAFGMASMISSTGRFVLAARDGAPIFAPQKQVDRRLCRQLLGFGVLVTFSQLADFLYAPTDNILINWFLSPRELADYGIAMQVDAGMLLLSGAVAVAIFPRVAGALAQGKTDLARRYYFRGTLATLGLLLAAALVIVLVAPSLFKLWLHNDMPGTRAILPLLLVHSVAGGASGIGRALLLAAGKARTFALATLIAGAANVGISYFLVRFTNLGLHGIVLGTVIAVLGRCMIWMPWYVLRTLRAHEAANIAPQASFALPETP